MIDAMRGDYVIVRTYSAGVFAGVLSERDGREVLLRNARRLWFWSGAASLSELSVSGVKHPSRCRFPGAVPSILLTEMIEMLPVSMAAQASIEAVPEWRA